MQNYAELKSIIESDPLWYKNELVTPFIQVITTSEDDLSEENKKIKRELINIFKTSNLKLSTTGYDWDQWRLPIDTAVIHHTATDEDVDIQELSILGMLRLYVPQYLKDEDVINQPMCSHHYWFNKEKTQENMTFVSYHYLVRPDGSIEQLVDDAAYLWHAGNLEINRKSLGIALAGKFIDKEPTESAIAAIAGIIKSKGISTDKVFGHQEIIKKKLLGETQCPGNTFLISWKQKLLNII